MDKNLKKALIYSIALILLLGFFEAISWTLFGQNDRYTASWSSPIPFDEAIMRILKVLPYMIFILPLPVAIFYIIFKSKK